MQSRNPHLDFLQQGAVCLTATNRLARQLMSDYDQAMVESGQKAWNRPVVQTLDTWCVGQFENIIHTDLLLNSSQALYLWETIIQNDVVATGHDLLQVGPTAKKARQACRLLEEFLVSYSSSGLADDHRAFLRWHDTWQNLLAEKHWVDPYSIMRRVTDALLDGRLDLAGDYILSGFDDFNPRQVKLIEALRQTGSRVEIPQPAAVESPPGKIFNAADARSEVDQCGRWIREVLSREPMATIGIVAPQLENYRRLVLQQIYAELDPAGYLSGSDKLLPFNISLGSQLADEGPVAAALKMLALPALVPLDDVSWLLRTPYIASADNCRDSRGRTDSELRRKRIFNFPLWKVRGVLKSCGCDDQFGAAVAALTRFLKNGRLLLPGAWAELIAESLQACGWPGDRSMSSREYQVVSKFRELLNEMARLDAVSGPISRSAAVSYLQRLSREASFLAESTDSRVQVLGLLEAGGLHFDYLWILGLHSGAMPQPIRPNPFIPHTVQRQNRMPHADANRELDYARQLLERLCSSSRHVMISWPRHDGDMINRPSRLLPGLSGDAPAILSSNTPTEVLFSTRPDTETLTDCKVTPIVSKKAVSGGTAIVKDQALCPFRAFAHHRLKAKGLENADIGIDALMRGTLVHGLLEFFWAEVHSHGRLCALEEEPRRSLLEAAAKKAISREESINKVNFPPLQRQIEIKRLVGQGLKWLELEQKRAPFVVAEQEELHEETIGQLHFRTKVDRIDRLDDGTLAVIDYKTGIPDPLQWFEQRMSEPQLPIYCHNLVQADIGAVVFAVVRNRERECRFSGIARHPGNFPRMNEKRLQALLTEKGWESIDQVLESWKQTLTDLGNAFVQGESSVDPVDPFKTCQFCDLVTLCRVHENDLWPLWETGND